MGGGPCPNSFLCIWVQAKVMQLELGSSFKLVGEVLEVPVTVGKEKKRMEPGERCTRSLDTPVEVWARRGRGWTLGG